MSDFAAGYEGAGNTSQNMQWLPDMFFLYVLVQLQDFRFSQQCSWKSKCSRMLYCVEWLIVTDISKDCDAFLVSYSRHLVFYYTFHVPKLHLKGDTNIFINLKVCTEFKNISLCIMQVFTIHRWRSLEISDHVNINNPAPYKKTHTHTHTQWPMLNYLFGNWNDN